MLLALALAAVAGPKAPAVVVPACVTEGQKAVAEAGPAAAGKAWLELAVCDAAAARLAAPEAWKKIIAGPGADAAGVKAIELGLGEHIRAWADTQQPDEKSAFVNTLGEQCENGAVPAFFVESEKALGAKFWSGRWFAGLDACRTPAAVALLTSGLESQKGERGRFKAVLETLARNLGKDAIPVLMARLAVESDPEFASYEVGAFADAAGVGSVAGLNLDAAALAVAAITKLAPVLPEPALESARTTLLALRDELASDSMAAQRYRALAQADGSLHYALYVTKVGACKKDTKIEVHTVLLTNAGRTWPDQVATRAASWVDAIDWKLPKDCVGTVTVTASATPIKDRAAFDAFTKGLDTELQKKNDGVKVKVFAAESHSL
ncbi:MAG: hypothetical protein EXR71_02895 [Myxococcales bacterium]|nr:hypothetical protein [Myxococcales bacterium]